MKASLENHKGQIINMCLKCLQWPTAQQAASTSRTSALTASQSLRALGVIQAQAVIHSQLTPSFTQCLILPSRSTGTFLSSSAHLEGKPGAWSPGPGSNVTLHHLLCQWAGSGQLYSLRWLKQQALVNYSPCKLWRRRDGLGRKAKKAGCDTGKEQLEATFREPTAFSLRKEKWEERCTPQWGTEGQEGPSIEGSATRY